MITPEWLRPCLAPLPHPSLLSSPVRPYLPGLIKLPVRGRGWYWSCGWKIKSEREWQTEFEQWWTRACGSVLSQKGKGVIIDVDRRSTQPFISCINTLCHLPHPLLFWLSSIDSCYILPWHTNTHTIFSRMFVSSCCCLAPPRLFLFGILPTYSLLHLFPLPPFPLSLSVQLYISAAAIGIFHLPASFPIGCQPASPRQLQ